DCSSYDRVGHARRRQAHVVSDGDPLRLELLDVRPPDRVAALLVQLARIEAANVVRLEDLRIEHGRMLREPFSRSRAFIAPNRGLIRVIDARRGRVIAPAETPRGFCPPNSPVGR